MGLVLGLAAGVTTGVTLAIELNRTARGLDYYSLPWEGMFSAIRAFGFGAGLYEIVGIPFAVAFALLITIGQILVYSRGMRPAIDYVAARRLRPTRRQFWGTVVRTIGYIASALFSALLSITSIIPGDLRFGWAWLQASSPALGRPSTLTSNTMLTIFQSDG